MHRPHFITAVCFPYSTHLSPTFLLTLFSKWNTDPLVLHPSCVDADAPQIASLLLISPPMILKSLPSSTRSLNRVQQPSNAARFGSFDLDLNELPPGSDELLSAASATTEAEAEASGAVAPEFRPQEDDNSFSVIKARIASHPHYPRLIQTYIDFQKVNH
ncbi:hypothetical protein K1719_045712 [Acacia pycnantha]|nr:hypothetical protein K1719_045712 [Acacia pycnantha]